MEQNKISLNNCQTLWRSTTDPTVFMLLLEAPETPIQSTALDQEDSYIATATVQDFLECCEENDIRPVAAWLHLKAHSYEFTDLLTV